MNRRTFVLGTLSLVTANYLFASDKTKFTIAINGDLDDDLIILKSTTSSSNIVDIQQMHNPEYKFTYNGNIYNVEHNPGYIIFNKEFEINKGEIYCVCLANEREEAGFPLSKRFRTHYKSVKLEFNKQQFFPAFMPEHNSVPGYPLWFGENEVPRFDRKDENGNTYNYYNLHENSIVPFGLVLPSEGKIEIKLFNQNNEMMYSYNDEVKTTVKNLKPNEKINMHPFTELNNILLEDNQKQIPNNDYITNAVVVFEGELYNIPLPYPIMYPNLIYTVAAK